MFKFSLDSYDKYFRYSNSNFYGNLLDHLDTPARREITPVWT